MAYWGSFTSCYEDLEQDQITALERAIRLQVLGQFIDADAAFQDPCLQNDHLLFAVERATLYERIGLERKRADILALAVDTASFKPDSHAAALYDLACVLRSNAEFFAYGLAKSGIRTTLAIGRRLALKSTVDLSDVEVSHSLLLRCDTTDACCQARCMLECHKFACLCRRESNWFEDEDGVLRKGLDVLPPVVHLRTAMQGLGRHMVALDLLKSESSVSNYTDEQAVSAYQDFLTSVSGLELNGGEAVLVKIATIKIFYAQELSGVARNHDAESQLSQAEQLMHRSVIISRLANEISPRVRLLIARARYSMHRHASLSAQRNQDLEFEEQARQIRDFCIQRVHLRSAIVKTKALLVTADGSYDQGTWQQYRGLLIRYMAFESDTLQVAYFYVNAVCKHGVEYVTQTKRKLRDFFELIADVERRFDRFEIPQMQRDLMHQASRAASSLSDPQLAAQYNEKAVTWHLECPGVKRLSQGTFSYNNLTDDNYVIEWRLDHDDHWCERYMTISMRVLLRYVKVEMATSLLTEEDVKVRIGWDRFSHGPASAPVDLDSVNEITVRNVIFGAVDPHTRKTIPVSRVTWESWIGLIRTWLLDAGRPPSKIQRQHLLYQIERCRAQSLADYAMTLDRSMQFPYIKVSASARERCLDLERTLDRRVVSRRGVRATAWCVASNTVALSTYVTEQQEHGVTDEMLSRAIDIYRSFETAYESEDDLLNLSRTCAAKGRAMLQRWLLFRSGKATDCLASFERSEVTYGQLRRETVLEKPSRSFLAKSYLAEGLGLEETYSLALFACVLMFLETDRSKPQSDHFGAAIFSWIQKSKARALTDLMGLVAQAPAATMNPIEASSSAVSLLKDERAVLERLDVASPVEKITIREELQQHSVKMRESEPLLVPLLDIREGTSISADQLQTLGKELDDMHHRARGCRGNVVIFEWVYFTAHNDLQQDLLLLVYRDGLLEHQIELNIRLEVIEEWVSKELDDPDLKDRPLASGGGMAALEKLEALVEPVLDHSNPDDTLIFCPTRALHRLPLHALSPRGSLLIDRNPIHYCQSLSLLRLCHQTQSTSDAPATFQASVFNTLVYPSGTREKNPVNLHIDQIAQTLHTTTITQQEISKPLFRRRGRTSCVIHVHGHIGFDATNPLQHHLVLRDPARSAADKYTADDIFDTPFRAPALILAMGCNGGRSTRFECDDLLGLTAAFHYSGASAVISTLWKVGDADCLRFSAAFHASLMRGMTDDAAEPSSSRAPVDVAAAFREAVVAARRNERGRYLSPYSWAAFYLHGSGLFPKFSLPPAGAAPG